MLGLTPSLIAQFKPVNTIATPAFPGLREFRYERHQPLRFPSCRSRRARRGSRRSPCHRALCSTPGTYYYQLSNLIPTANYANGGTLTISGPASGSTPSTVTLYNNSDPATCCNPYYGESSTQIGIGPESIFGLGFFSQQFGSVQSGRTGGRLHFQLRDRCQHRDHIGIAACH